MTEDQRDAEKVRELARKLDEESKRVRDDFESRIRKLEDVTRTAFVERDRYEQERDTALRRVDILERSIVERDRYDADRAATFKRLEMLESKNVEWTTERKIYTTLAGLAVSFVIAALTAVISKFIGGKP